MKTSKLSTNPTDFQTRAVLAGAYGKRTPTDRQMLTHLVLTASDDKVLCRTVKPGNVADEYSNSAGNALRPTCPICAVKWDRLHGVVSSAT